MAGKRARCGCGHVVAVPASEPDDLYDIVEESKPKRVMPAEPPPASGAAGVGGGAGAGGRARDAAIAYAGAKRPREVDRDLAMSFWGHPDERKVPLVTLGVALVLLLGLEFSKYPNPFTGGIVLLFEAIAVGTILAGAFVTSKLAGIGFGVLGLAIIRMSAVVVTLDAIHSVFMYKPFLGAFLVSWAVRLVVYYAMMMKMFDLEFRDVFILGLVCFVIRMLVAIGMVATMMNLGL